MIRLPPEWSTLKKLQFLAWVEDELKRDAQAIEARRAETQGGSVADESAVPERNAP